MSNRGKMVATLMACAGVVACQSGQGEDLTGADIARVADLKAGFGPEFTVSSVGPAAVDPRLLAPQTLPPGLTFDPPECADSASERTVPEGTKGNMAAVTAEGEGVRYIVIAVETSAPVPVNAPDGQCDKVTFNGAGLRGLVEVVEAPQIEHTDTVGTHRVLQTTTAQGPRTGQLYNYVAKFGNFLVIVTANPLVVADRPLADVDTARARDLVTEAVGLVRG
ncbi:hypothetical protein CRI77_09475 [Mycolicibacterium duvalii]|uniref:Uncharacterized protein n=1 Tax=Mycolicibacterium duvalii TaxID=39688 RepID=A0A7I7KAT3_9MYCO|nr:DUF5642 family protein [Mycolicibacterium duvalii]MCV7368370.1 DUF5642 family protein [Mycolicibacterium duvalii]PEG41918.1 hypothetical protein CRI77_09475 [Mycolicibacterium duvalii]BBX20472.1 hypothetical protein MDUV_53320 [Mycolicibacterium duvalii]